jgi:hypothetical protein
MVHDHIRKLRKIISSCDIHELEYAALAVSDVRTSCVELARTRGAARFWVLKPLHLLSLVPLSFLFLVALLGAS